MRTAILITRKHGAKTFEMDPRSCIEGNLDPLWNDFRKLLAAGKSHPQFAEVRYHDDKPMRVIRFKSAAEAKAEDARREKDNATMRAAEEAQRKETLVAVKQEEPKPKAPAHAATAHHSKSK